MPEFISNLCRVGLRRQEACKRLPGGQAGTWSLGHGASDSPGGKDLLQRVVSKGLIFSKNTALHWWHGCTDFNWALPWAAWQAMTSCDNCLCWGMAVVTTSMPHGREEAVAWSFRQRCLEGIFYGARTLRHALKNFSACLQPTIGHYWKSPQTAVLCTNIF